MSTIQDEEQDLDAALDSILGDHAAAQATKPTRLRIEKKVASEEPPHRGAPMPPTLVEQVRYTYTYPYVLCVVVLC